MEWRDYIHSDQSVLSGKPVVRGTRLSVEFLLELLAEGWNEQKILENYPQISQEALQAIFVFAEAVPDQPDGTYKRTPRPSE